MPFEECKGQVAQQKELKDLFKLWRKAHAVEVEEIEKKMELLKDKDTECEGKIFEHILYQGKVKDYKNTISSHFIQFFYKQNCVKCNRGKEVGPNKAWKYVLANSFNMDGCYGTFKLPKEGFKYICLLKEANDSEKVCVENYDSSFDKSKINEWIIKEKEKANMLVKLNAAFGKFFKSKHNLECKDFTNEMAYINVNKRGGTSTTAGVDETAVINYARKYKDFILKEIDILKYGNKEVRVFVCGGKSYFERLMRALFEEKVEIDSEKVIAQPNEYNNLLFVQIPHPSYWKITPEKLKEAMGKV